VAAPSDCMEGCGSSAFGVPEFEPINDAKSSTLKNALPQRRGDVKGHWSVPIRGYADVVCGKVLGKPIPRPATRAM
jgi:hypothetical protein